MEGDNVRQTNASRNYPENLKNTLKLTLKPAQKNSPDFTPKTNLKNSSELIPDSKLKLTQKLRGKSAVIRDFLLALGAQSHIPNNFNVPAETKSATNLKRISIPK